MNSTNKSLQAMLFNTIASHLAEYGFKKRDSQTLQRIYDWGKAVIHLVYIEHDDDFDVTVDVAIRFDSVEDLVNKNNTILSANEKKNSFSMGTELGNLQYGEPKRWTIASSSDVTGVAEGIREQILETGIPYIKQYSDMNKALDALSGDGDDAWLYSPIHNERAKRAVAMAWLLGDEKRTQYLIESKTQFLRNRNDFGLGKFESFVKSLEDL